MLEVDFPLPSDPLEKEHVTPLPAQNDISRKNSTLDFLRCAHCLGLSSLLELRRLSSSISIKILNWQDAS